MSHAVARVLEIWCVCRSATRIYNACWKQTVDSGLKSLICDYGLIFLLERIRRIRCVILAERRDIATHTDPGVNESNRRHYSHLSGRCFTQPEIKTPLCKRILRIVCGIPTPWYSLLSVGNTFRCISGYRPLTRCSSSKF